MRARILSFTRKLPEIPARHVEDSCLWSRPGMTASDVVAHSSTCVVVAGMLDCLLCAQ